MGEELQELRAALQLGFAGRTSRSSGRTHFPCTRLEPSHHRDAQRAARGPQTLSPAHLPFPNRALGPCRWTHTFPGDPPAPGGLRVAKTSPHLVSQASYFLTFRLSTWSGVRSAITCSQGNARGGEAPERAQHQLTLRKAREGSAPPGQRNVTASCSAHRSFVTWENQTVLASLGNPQLPTCLRLCVCPKPTGAVWGETPDFLQNK